jgi:hypothetical protein
MIKLKKLLTEALKTFSQIQNELDPDGTKHDLTLTCIQCGTTTTCRCSKPKRKITGVCDSCSKITEDEDENVPVDESLNSIEELTDTVLGEMAAAAQVEYDGWIQDERGYNEELGSGGICHLIADKMLDVLYKHKIENVQTVSSTHEQHVYLVGKFKEGVYTIDIHYSNYETGGGFNWKKIPNVVFDKDYIYISKLDGDPNNFGNYIDQM